MELNVYDFTNIYQLIEILLSQQLIQHWHGLQKNYTDKNVGRNLVHFSKNEGFYSFLNNLFRGV